MKKVVWHVAPAGSVDLWRAENSLSEVLFL